MKTVQTFVVGLTAIALATGGIAFGYWIHPSVSSTQPATASVAARAAQPPSDRKLNYYQDPDGKADYSPTPKKTADGRNYVPVYDEASPAPHSNRNAQAALTTGGRGRVLYYRNPMGLADTSPVPKKDSMGMDYIAVHEGEDESGLVTVSPQRVQMLGVKTASVEVRSSLTRSIRATGTIQPDESRLAVVTTKFDGFVEKLFVSTTGAPVRKGQPLAQVWIQTPDVVTQMGPDVITRQIDYIVALQEHNSAAIDQAVRNLRNYGIPDSAIAEIRRTGRAVRSVTLSAPLSGTVLEKTATQGMHFNAGDPLFKTADLSTVWLLADVAEQDLGNLHTGEAAHVSFVAYSGRTFTGTVDFIYPSLTAATRTGRVRIVLPNTDALLRESMYASVTIDAPAAPGGQALVVPDSAVIDSGARQVVIVARGGGRFEPRAVHIGAHGDGYVQVLDGLKPGEQVVVSANFLIDAESNLRAALQAFSPDANKGAGTP